MARPKPAAGEPGAGAPVAAGAMYGEGNWKADEDYREDLKEFSDTHDAEELAREAAEEVEEQPAAGAAAPVEEEDEEW
ncbi:MAG TPA: hypothetical protein VER78_01400 [Thermoanaerobaculia bacterium]|nr:hypothetical protein [Thermoanaerobaculia bacterium]